MGNRASLLEAELEKLKSERDSEQLARARQRVDKLEADNAKLRSGLDELSGRLEEADKELNELWEGLVESQRQLREQKVDRHKADDELLKLMRENESLKAELPGRSITNYKQSVPAFFGVVAVFMVETIIYALVPFLGLGLDVVWWCQEPLPLIWRKILVRVEFRGIIGGRERLKSGPSILLLDDPEVDPWGCSVRGRFCSSRFSTIRVSAAMKWFALYIISGIVVGGFSTKDQNSLDGRIPIKKAWITKEGYASGIARVSVANLLTN
ncbi:hypothetical protein BHM03_00004840 [Ensete ventricosum]|uniref:Uncharacterized protein n=1 Tax=Ensete ventricosum TaxID=4639 RepID=A0A445MAS2_ENSVE|nr:hypothetical protein BHM03_00004840 [Ensete ventricosum]